MPAVQKVRAAAANTTCRNNLKQIALAAHNYESEYGFLPPGSAQTPDRFAGSKVGTLAYLLPYLEQENVYRQIPSYLFSDTTGIGWYRDSQADAAAKVRIKTFECPALDLSKSVENALFLAQYSDAYNAFPRPNSFGRTTYSGSLGMLGTVSRSPHSRYRGVFYANSRTRVTDIVDGTTNTIAFGEVTGGNSRLMFGIAWMGNGGHAALFGLPKTPEWFTFGSTHTGGVNFAMADGSIRTIRSGIDRDNSFSNPKYMAFQALIGTSDGDIFDDSLLGN